MLIKFCFRNYKSFKDETILDLSAAKITEFNERVVTIGNVRILPVAAIYGANASGKSNVYSAFEYMSKYVEYSFNYGDEEESYRAVRPVPFLFSEETENADTGFEIYFTLPQDDSGKVYNYRFCAGNDGVNEERLNYKTRTARKYASVFYRETATNVWLYS